MTSSTLTALRTRVAALAKEARTRERQRASFTQTTNQTPLPGADRWPAFARRTWINTTGTVAPFNPYDYQIDLVAEVHGGTNIIVNKSRQVGVSETVVNYLACRGATEPGFTAVIFSKTQKDSSGLARRARMMLNSIQGHRFAYESDSNTMIAIKGGGTLHFLPGSARASRGIPSCSVLWLDEAAFVEGAEAIYAAAEPTLAMLGDAGKVIITSTPDMELGFFGNFWHKNLFPDWYDYVKRRAFDELNDRLAEIEDDWTRVAIHYSQHPIYSADPEWAAKRRAAKNIPMPVWNAEYELSFGSTNSQIYPASLVKRAARAAHLECGLINRDYVVGIDPNAGGDDYFVALVLDITSYPYAVVAMYRENGRSTKYSLTHVKALIEDFVPRRVCIEKQAMGAVIGEQLQDVLPNYAIELFNTNRVSKNTATDRVLFHLEQDHLIFPPGPVSDELRAFQRKEDGKREAAAGYNDDTVMALAMAVSLIPENVPTAAFFDAL
jgi:hypothetical protein